MRVTDSASETARPRVTEGDPGCWCAVGDGMQEMGIPPPPGRRAIRLQEKVGLAGPRLAGGPGPGGLREGRCARRSPWSLFLMAFWIAGKEEFRPQAN